MALNDLAVSVTSATGFVAGNFLKIDDEYMLIDRSYVSGTMIPVFRRGDRGSTVAAHNALAITATGLSSDMANLPAGNLIQDSQSPLGWDIVTYSVSGAIAIPTRDTMVVLDKATAAVMTLAAPGADQDGLQLYVTSTTAAAHTITATTLLADGLTGSPHTTVTFAAFKGAGIRLRALAGLWQVESIQNAPVT